MRFSNSIKSIPFISIFLLLLVLGISNQKENAKLRILIWNTPTLSLGSNIAISTSTGFIFGYSINVIIRKLIYSQAKKQFIFRDTYRYNDNIDKPIESKYHNTLIERDIKDPSPTITADFRIISRKEDAKNEFLDNKIQDDDLFKSVVIEREMSAQIKTNNNDNSSRTDWFDQSYSDW